MSYVHGPQGFSLIFQVFSVLGALLMGLSETAGSFEMLVVGRLSTGVACGLFTALSPLYVSEIAPVKIRGQLGVINQVKNVKHKYRVALPNGENVYLTQGVAISLKN